MPSVSPGSMFLPQLNSIEPPWYGPVCPVVWEGRHREVSPYPDPRREGVTRRATAHGLLSPRTDLDRVSRLGTCVTFTTKAQRAPPAICGRGSRSPASRNEDADDEEDEEAREPAGLGGLTPYHVNRYYFGRSKFVRMNCRDMLALLEFSVKENSDSTGYAKFYS